MDAFGHILILSVTVFEGFLFAFARVHRLDPL